MVHLLSRGYVLPVVGYIRRCLEKLNTDISLIRYFVTEVERRLDAWRLSRLSVNEDDCNARIFDPICPSYK
jgi:hypothetical protein